MPLPVSGTRNKLQRNVIMQRITGYYLSEIIQGDTALAWTDWFHFTGRFCRKAIKTILIGADRKSRLPCPKPNQVLIGIPLIGIPCTLQIRYVDTLTNNNRRKIPLSPGNHQVTTESPREAFFYEEKMTRANASLRCHVSSNLLGSCTSQRSWSVICRLM